jgi:hypothetical protein
LNFNHPCKELIWVVQPDENVDYCASLECSENLYKLLGAQPFNYTDAVDALPNAIHAFSTQGGLVDMDDNVNVGYIDSSGLFQQAGPAGLSGVGMCLQALSAASAAGEPNVAAAINTIVNGVQYQGSTGPDTLLSDITAASSAAEICAAVAQSKYGVALQGWNSNGVSGLQHSPGDASTTDPRGYGSPQFGVPMVGPPTTAGSFGGKSQSQLVGVSDAGTFVLLRLLLPCTAGDKTLLLPLSFSLTDKIASLSVRVPTLTWYSHSSTTHVTQTLVSTYTPSHFALRSTSHLEPVTSPVLTMLLFSLFFPTLLLREPRPLRYVSTLPTTMSFVS